ncbi:hypothetical protein CVT24_005577 [Panaeolus cyanescens]|uniref:Uncharacterized protein n=1 Tax=Panaeolus cyanescens TaxID=181874 RepID=A0A409YXZ0_9AGAR|nr:hypothetical protein CVT24_005577 [Panaeolus cyanescens]
MTGRMTTVVCHPSAIGIITEMRWASTIDSFYLHQGPLKHFVSPLLIAELLERIQNAQREREGILEDRIRHLSGSNRRLDSILMKSLQDVNGQIANYTQQLVEFGAPPPGLDVNPQSIQYQCLLDTCLAPQQFIHHIESILASLPRRSILRRFELHSMLNNAKNDFLSTYAKLRAFGEPPPGFQSFIPSVVLQASDITKLERIERRMQTGH